MNIDLNGAEDDTQPAFEEIQQDQLDSRDVCVACLLGDRAENSWVGCDKCGKWYHYECLASSVRTNVDLLEPAEIGSVDIVKRSNY